MSDRMVPEHIAIIMDGNGRWAKQKGFPRNEGHRRRTKALEKIVSYADKIGVKHLTVYAFSTENWSRPQDEIDHLFEYLDEFFLSNIDEFMERGVRVQMMGEMDALPLHSQETISKAIDMTKNNSSFFFNICLNYGSRQEIVRATKLIVKDVQEGKILESDIDEKLFSSYLYSSNLPPIDLMIRTSGEQRLSNFLLYQLAYSEFIFTPTCWPDFKADKLIECLEEFATRNRRFGGLINK